ncbi:MAG: hypothetical protein II332_05340 [Kiritimatiellae bacterium]|nr:hypothetical protein [Kiritimatiellia bacterium]
MKKIIVFFVAIFALVFNGKAELFEYCAIRVKSINEVSNVATAMGADLQLGIVAYSVPMLLAQAISENFITPALDKPLTGYVYVDEEKEITDSEEFEPDAFVICIPYVSAKEEVISKLNVELINEEKQLYSNAEDYFVVLKDGYAIFSNQQKLCENIAASNGYDFKTSLKADLVTISQRIDSIGEISFSPEEIEEMVFEGTPKSLKKVFVSVMKTVFDVINTYKTSEVGLTYKKDLGLILESSTSIDKTTEYGKLIDSHSSFVSIDEAVKIKSNSLFSGIIKENKFEKRILNQFISALAMTQSEFDEIYTELLKKEEITNLFSFLKEEGMNVKLYEGIKKFANDTYAVSEAMEEVCFDIDITENNNLISVEKTTYKNGFDISPYEKASYKGIIDIYNYVLENADYKPASPLVTLMNPLAVNFNLKAALNEVKKNSSESEIEEMDECLAVAKSVNITIPDSYTMQTFIEGKETYSYIAPESMDVAQLKNKFEETKSNEFIRSAMTNISDNKPYAVMQISPAGLFNKFYNIAATLMGGEDVLKEAGLIPSKQSDAIVFVNGFANNDSIYESVVIGKDTLLLIANLATFAINEVNMDECEYIEEDEIIPPDDDLSIEVE